MGMMDCKFGKAHDYAKESGWCIHGCGVRDDGRVISWQGEVLQDAHAKWQTSYFNDPEPIYRDQ
jgi:hypothetical protein